MTFSDMTHRGNLSSALCTWVLCVAVALFAGSSMGVATAAFNTTASGSTDMATRDLLGASGLAATGVCVLGLAQASLTWTAGSSWADHQEVWRSTTSGSDGTKIATKAPGDTSHTDTSIALSTTYYYRVKTVKGPWTETTAEVTVPAVLC